ncbi:MAG TPA: GntR family transcriptional regulator [Victivallales bacterium]|nr:GntR family transcriptional regulator [Victivallales bacterium]
MEFKQSKTISLQIAETISENILQESWVSGDRIPSVREYASSIEVNPNTIVRSYSYLEDLGIISKKRGIGYFVNDDAKKIILKKRKNEFLEKQLPDFFNSVDLLDIEWEEITKKYTLYKTREQETNK